MLGMLLILRMAIQASNRFGIQTTVTIGLQIFQVIIVSIMVLLLNSTVLLCSDDESSQTSESWVGREYVRKQKMMTIEEYDLVPPRRRIGHFITKDLDANIDGNLQLKRTPVVAHKQAEVVDQTLRKAIIYRDDILY